MWGGPEQFPYLRRTQEILICILSNLFWSSFQKGKAVLPPKVNHLAVLGSSPLLHLNIFHPSSSTNPCARESSRPPVKKPSSYPKSPMTTWLPCCSPGSQFKQSTLLPPSTCHLLFFLNHRSTAPIYKASPNLSIQSNPINTLPISTAKSSGT